MAEQNCHFSRKYKEKQNTANVLRKLLKCDACASISESAESLAHTHTYTRMYISSPCLRAERDIL